MADSYLWWSSAGWAGQNNRIKSEEINNPCSPVIYFLWSILSLLEKALNLSHSLDQELDIDVMIEALHLRLF